MYDLAFTAYSGSDWAQAIQLIDDTTGQAFDATDVSFELEVQDRGDYRALQVSTDEGTIERPSPSVIQWRFSVDQMKSLCIGNTYSVGCRMRSPGGTTALFRASLAYLDGDIA